MKDRVEPGFPNQRVFERLGTKLDLETAERLLRHRVELLRPSRIIVTAT